MRKFHKHLPVPTLDQTYYDSQDSRGQQIKFSCVKEGEVRAVKRWIKRGEIKRLIAARSNDSTSSSESLLVL
jgi:hypothetical protein